MRIPLAFALLLSASAQAGSVNLVNLVKRDTTRFTFTQGDAKETFELPAGSSSGKFQSDSGIVIRCIEVPGAETTIAAKEGDVFVVFHETNGKPEWRVLPSKPTEGTFSLRILNLGPGDVTVKAGGKEIPMAADAIHEIGKPEGRRLTVSIPETDASQTFDPAEPSAGLAILHKQDDAWRITLIPDI
jgi:hypothetical protein